MSPKPIKPSMPGAKPGQRDDAVEAARQSLHQRIAALQARDRLPGRPATGDSRDLHWDNWSNG